MEYRFVKIRRKGSDKSNWYFVPKTEDQLLEHFKHVFGAEIRDGVHDHIKGTHVKEDPEGKKEPWFYHDHPTTPWARAVEVYWNLFGGSWVEASTKLENETLNQRINSFRSGKEMLLDNGVVESRFCEGDEILEDIEKDKLEYPIEAAVRLEDVRYMQWGKLDYMAAGLPASARHYGGNHWYAKLGKQDIVDKDGNMKWNTKEEAQTAAKWFIENKVSHKRYHTN